MELMKKVIAVSLVVSISINSTYASLADYIQQNLDGAVQQTNAGYYKTQVGGIYTLGETKMRWNLGGTTYPINITPPSVDVGCGGIDITWGGFSYLNFNYLVEKLKKIAAAAPAFAFQMAIKTLCQQCGTIMSNLEKIANAINGLNFDSCKASYSLGKKILGFATDENTKNGKNDSWLDGIASSINEPLNQMYDWIDGLKNKFGDNEATKKGANIFVGLGSMVKNVFEKFSLSLGGDNMEDVMRALVGDVFGFQKSYKSADGKDNYIKVVNVLEPVGDVNKFVEVLTKGGKYKKQKANITKDPKGFVRDIKFKTEDVEISDDKTVTAMIRKKLKSIIDKINTHQKLTAQDLQFINSMPLPVYKIVNITTITNDSTINDIVAEYMAYEVIKSFLKTYFVKAIEALNYYESQKDVEPLDKEDIEKYAIDLRKRMIALSTQIDKLMVDKKRVMESKVNILRYYKDLERDMLRNSPIWQTMTL